MLTLNLPANAPAHGICCIHGKLCEYEKTANILRSRRLDGAQAWDAWKILGATLLRNNLVAYACSDANAGHLPATNQ